MPPKKASTPAPSAGPLGRTRQRTAISIHEKKKNPSESTEPQEAKDQGIQKKETVRLIVIGRKDSPHTKLWKLLQPTSKLRNLLDLEETKLVISVIGGSPDFLSHTRLQAFKRQLMTAALNTDALIFTEGSYRTQMALFVKEALSEFGLLESQRVVALTIANPSATEPPAGKVQSKDRCCTTLCCRSSKVRGREEPEKCEKTVDVIADCTSDSPQSVSFRLQVQQQIASELGVSLVLLLVNQDPEMVEAIKKAVFLHIPVIFIQGLGGLVDCLTMTKPDREKQGSNRDHIMESDCKDILTLFKTKSPLNVCKLARDANSQISLFEMIRTAVIPEDDKKKVEMAVSWPDFRLARELISEGTLQEMNKDRKDDKRPDMLHSLMLKALVVENTDFVDFLLDNGVSIKAFLTQGNLRELYESSVFSARNASSSKPAVGSPQTQDLYMQDVIDMFDVLLGDVYNFREKTVTVDKQSPELSDKEKQEVHHLRLMFKKKISEHRAEQAKEETNGFIGILFTDTRERNLAKFGETVKRVENTSLNRFSELVKKVNKQQKEQVKRKNLALQKGLHKSNQNGGTAIPREDGTENQTTNSQVKRQNLATQEDGIANQTIDWEKILIDWYTEAIRKRNQANAGNADKKDTPQDQNTETVDIFDMDLQNSTHNDEDRHTFKHPDLLLFLWAIVSSKFEMAQFLWRDVKDRLTAALIACITLKAMKKRIVNNPAFMDEREEYAEKIQVFEGLAIEVLNKCNNEDADKTRQLLTRTQAFWEKLTCLEIADQAKCTQFIAQESCQALAEKIWKGKDKERDDEGSNDRDPLQILLKLTYAFFAFFVVVPTLLLECSRNKRSGAYLWKSLKRIVENFPDTSTSPAFKFYLNWFFFLGFLFLYMYVLLVRIPVDTYEIPELVLFFWFFTLYMEEVRLSTVMIPRGTKGKVSYFILNQIGFLNVTNYYLGLLTIAGWLINNQSPYLHGALCVNFIGFVVRLFFFLSINTQLGPRIFMMRRMVRDIIIFSVILVIMCFTYGTVVYSLQNKGAVRELQLSSVLELPVTGFWLMLGNQPQDDANEDNTDLRIVIRGLLRVVYMMIACILMINLLIAAFSHTFNMVQEKKEEVRKYQRFQMIYRFYYQCPVPPPFNIFFYPVWFAYWSVQCCRNGSQGDSFRQDLRPDDEEELLVWANNVVDTYSTGSSDEEEPVKTQVSDVIRKVQRIEKTNEGLYSFRENEERVRLRDISTKLKDIQESVQSLAATVQRLQGQRPSGP